MSQENGVLPDPRAAYAHILENVHARVFFQKCAQHGIAPRSYEEAQVMLETTAKLRALADSEQVKAAGVQDNPYYQMNAQLDKVLEQYGIGKQANFEDVEVGFKQAAAQVMQDPNIYNSVLSLKVAEATAMQAEFAAQGRKA